MVQGVPVQGQRAVRSNCQGTCSAAALIRRSGYGPNAPRCQVFLPDHHDLPAVATSTQAPLAGRDKVVLRVISTAIDLHCCRDPARAAWQAVLLAGFAG